MVGSRLTWPTIVPTQPTGTTFPLSRIKHHHPLTLTRRRLPSLSPADQHRRLPPLPLSVHTARCPNHATVTARPPPPPYAHPSHCGRSSGGVRRRCGGSNRRTPQSRCGLPFSVASIPTLPRLPSDSSPMRHLRHDVQSSLALQPRHGSSGRTSSPRRAYPGGSEYGVPSMLSLSLSLSLSLMWL
jgi:hypothetical protein